jgi:hypothetical protein
MLQRVITPELSREYLSHGLDQVRGYVLAAADVDWAQTPEQLFAVHALGFPGSPFDADQDSVDVLRFPATPFTHLVPAAGGTTAGERPVASGPFVDHPPFTGTGFAPASATAGHPPVPLWWVDAARLPAGSEIWRVRSSGEPTLLGVFENVAQGWVAAATPPTPDSPVMPASDVLGIFGTWSGARCLVDLIGDGYAIVASYVDIPGAELEPGPRGLFWRRVPAGQVQDVHEIRVTCTWSGAPFLLTAREQATGGEVAQLMYLGRDATAAEELQLTKTDAGVYAITVPMNELGAIQAKQFVQA